jgi:nitroreductase
VEADELLTTTRSARWRLDLSRPVSLRVVRECLEIALQAPNGGNRQAWRWIVVRDPGIRQELGSVYRSAFEARYPRSGEDCAPVLRGARYLAENLARVPILVVACIEVPGGRLPEGNQAGLWGSVLPAVWSYMLAARARGLATAWTSVHLDAEARAADLLGLPPTVRQAALIPTAVAVGGGFRRAPRRPLDDVLHVDRWSPRAGEGAR